MRLELNTQYNLYAVNLNPINYIDPLGLILFCIPWAEKGNWKVIDSELLRYELVQFVTTPYTGPRGMCTWKKTSWVHKTLWVQPGELFFYFICRKLDWFFRSIGEAYPEHYSGSKIEFLATKGEVTFIMNQIDKEWCQHPWTREWVQEI
jgi:hypothetical protein